MKTSVTRISGRTKLALTILSLSIFGISLSLDSCNPQLNQNNAESDSCSTDPLTAYYAFRNSVDTPTGIWKNKPTFELSHDYPTSLPAGGGDMPWLKVDVDFNNRNPTWDSLWSTYMDTILDYAFTGQDPNLVDSIGWQSKVNGQPEWFHVPWMAYDPRVGREFIHGCTSERVPPITDFVGYNRPLSALQKVALETTQSQLNTIGTINIDTPYFETWAVGMYNKYAGYSLGQLFPESGAPQLVMSKNDTLPKGLPFPVGTCVIKTLFTTATELDVLYLANAPIWTVNRHVLEQNSLDTFLCERSPQPVRLVQVDVAVVDPRSPTNWVFGTFAYDGWSKGATAKDRLKAVGIQFGMDSLTFPAVDANQSITAFQSILNKDIKIYEHFGCNSRLCGPVDNPNSSCMSCHGGAYTAPIDELDIMGKNIPPIFGFTDMCKTVSDTNKAYFNTFKYSDRYPFEVIQTTPIKTDTIHPYKKAIPLDFSLQVAVAFTQYKRHCLQGKPNKCTTTIR